MLDVCFARRLWQSYRELQACLLRRGKPSTAKAERTPSVGRAQIKGCGEARRGDADVNSDRTRHALGKYLGIQRL